MIRCLTGRRSGIDCQCNLATSLFAVHYRLTIIISIIISTLLIIHTHPQNDRHYHASRVALRSAALPLRRGFATSRVDLANTLVFLEHKKGTFNPPLFRLSLLLSSLVAILMLLSLDPRLRLAMLPRRLPSKFQHFITALICLPLCELLTSFAFCSPHCSLPVNA